MSGNVSIDLTFIQGLADKASREECPTPDFPIPEGCNTTISTVVETSTLMHIKDTEGKGKGLYATNDIGSGTILLASKPLSLVMNWEEDGDGEEDEMSVDFEDEDSDDGEDGIMKGSKRNGMLIVRIARAIKSQPSLWQDQVGNLFPRELSEDLPLWICRDPKTGMEIEEAMNALSQADDDDDDDDDDGDVHFSEDLIEEIRARLPLIVRYNCLSVETAPELFSYPNREGGGHISLSGTGLYYNPSYFNHSHLPNVSRFAIGDVMFFVANQPLKAGEELNISYIESEHLCESPELRSHLLDMDFLESSSDKIQSDSGSGSCSDDDKRYPIVDFDMQDELMSLNPLERLAELKELLSAATACGKPQDSSVDEEEEEIRWFKCDAHQLRILLALTYDILGQSSKAMIEWKTCIAFVEENLPPGAFRNNICLIQYYGCTQTSIFNI